jgi:CBS domain-containing protein
MSVSVKAILNEKGRNVITIASTASLLDAAKILHENKIGGTVILGPGDTIAGIFTERDLARAIAKDGPDSLGNPVSAYMTSNVYACREDTTVDQLMEVMTTRRFRHAPVEHDGKLAGIISIGDVVKNHIRVIEMEAQEIKAYIAG